MQRFVEAIKLWRHIKQRLLQQVNDKNILRIDDLVDLCLTLPEISGTSVEIGDARFLWQFGELFMWVNGLSEFLELFMLVTKTNANLRGHSKILFF